MPLAAQKDCSEKREIAPQFATFMQLLVWSYRKLQFHKEVCLHRQTKPTNYCYISSK